MAVRLAGVVLWPAGAARAAGSAVGVDARTLPVAASPMTRQNASCTIRGGGYADEGSERGNERDHDEQGRDRTNAKGRGRATAERGRALRPALMSAAGHDDGAGPDEGPRATEGLLERVCRIVSEVALIAMIGVVGLDIFTRSVLGFSYQISEEVASYLLVALAFFSLAVCQAYGSFHRVEMTDSLLPPRARLAARVLFDLMSLAVVAVLVWQLGRFELASFRSGFVAPTLLATPLWVPQLAMVLGAVCFAAAIVRTTLGHLRRLRALSGAAGER